MIRTIDDVALNDVESSKAFDQADYDIIKENKEPAAGPEEAKADRFGQYDTHLMDTDRLTRKLNRAFGEKGIALSHAEMQDLIYRIQYALEHNGSKLHRKEASIVKQTIKLHVNEVVGSYRGHAVTALQLGDAAFSLGSGFLGTFPASLKLLQKVHLFKGIHSIDSVMKIIDTGSKVFGTGANIAQRSLDNKRTEEDAGRNVAQTEKQKIDEQFREGRDRTTSKERQLSDAQKAAHELWMSAARG
jgi:hypothetical protein